jgi:hypothetical protein
VLSFRFVKSKVVPDGTATLDNTIVAQEAFDLLAAAAPLAPEKVQLAARSSIVAGWVTCGEGAASVETMPQAARIREVRSILRKKCATSPI